MSTGKKNVVDEARTRGRLTKVLKEPLDRSVPSDEGFPSIHGKYVQQLRSERKKKRNRCQNSGMSQPKPKLQNVTFICSMNGTKTHTNPHTHHVTTTAETISHRKCTPGDGLIDAYLRVLKSTCALRESP